MPGIKHLSEIYKKQGTSFLDDLFGREVIVSEKLNGMSFSFERSTYDGTIYFYKRDQNNPISKIDRVLMQQYDHPINHIKNLPEDIIDEIPAGWRFGMEYFYNNNPVAVSYQRTPLNGLVLTHITVKNHFGDIERTIVDKEELDYWADLLSVEGPPIIFQGKLSDEQKVAINDFVNSPNDTLKKDHGTSSFAKYLITLLNPNVNKSFLNNSLEEPIEGVVFRFGSLDGMGESFTAKILDPIFDDITKQNNLQKRSYFPNDIYGITLLDVMNFILDKGVDSFAYTGSEPSDRYISYICSVFNEFINKYGERYLGLDFQEPDYLKSENLGFNIDLITDQKTRELILSEESYKSLFKLILSAFRKIKKKEGGFFTKGSIEQFNILVREITEHLNRETIVVESFIPTFDQFRKVKKVFKPVPEEEDPDEEDSQINKEDPDKASQKNNQRELQKSEDNNVSDYIKNLAKLNSDTNFEGDPVNIVIGKFNPFHNGHYKLIKKSKEHNGLPVVVFVVNSGKGFLDKDALQKMMDLVSSDMSDCIKSVKFINNDLLSTVIDNMDSDCIPKTLTVGKKRLDNYLLQSRALKKKNKIPQEFQIQTAPEWVTSNQINGTLDKEDYLDFKKNVPKVIHPMWEEIKRSYFKTK